jgi:protein phosphatase 1 regulatory subunit 7
MLISKKSILDKLACLALIFLSHSLFAQRVSDIQFLDQNLRACVEQTAAVNNWLNVAEFTELKCHNSDIQSADEVALFTSLTSLSLYNNELVKIDLTDLKQLVYLNLANNRLQSLAISGLDKLETVYLFRNKLETIDLSGLSAVKKIRLMQNVLTRLDISPLKSLEMGYFFDNKLKDLQIIGLTKLTFLDVKQNPMPDELYDFYDQQAGIVISHNGNADDWK